MTQARSVPPDETDTRVRKPKSIASAVSKMAREMNILNESVAGEEVDRTKRRERLVKLFRTGFRGIEKSIANHPSYTPEDLEFFRQEGFNV